MTTWYTLVKDDSAHDYVIPVEKAAEWWRWVESEDCDVPDWATRVGGHVRFQQWEEY